MDSFVVPKSVVDAFEEKYKHIRDVYRSLPEAEAHRRALRVAIHEALLKEADLGLIMFTEKSAHWVPSPEDTVPST